MKSSVLEALSWFLSGKQISDTLLFRNKKTDKDNAIELIGTFDNLSVPDLQKKAIQGRTYQSNWILRKKYWIDPEKNKAESQYFSYGEIEDFSDWPEIGKKKSDWPKDYHDLIDKAKVNSLKKS